MKRVVIFFYIYQIGKWMKLNYNTPLTWCMQQHQQFYIVKDVGNTDNNMWEETIVFISKVDEHRQKWTPTKHKWARGSNNNY